jgi:hypothetical protein
MPHRRQEASNNPPSLEEWRSLLGRKVSLRYKLYEDPKYPESEVVGVVQSVGEPEDGRLTILDRHGRTHSMKAAEIIAAKVFP